jgi:hypothetical protein
LEFHVLGNSKSSSMDWDVPTSCGEWFILTRQISLLSLIWYSKYCSELWNMVFTCIFWLHQMDNAFCFSMCKKGLD